MKKKLLVLVVMSSLSLTASAQLWKASTKAVCTKRCIDGDSDHPKKEQHLKRLAAVRGKIKAESDPAKLDDLKKDEAQELERHQDELEQLCRQACKTNPDE